VYVLGGGEPAELLERAILDVELAARGHALLAPGLTTAERAPET
jgi:hypothetical protein